MAVSLLVHARRGQGQFEGLARPARLRMSTTRSAWVWAMESEMARRMDMERPSSPGSRPRADARRRVLPRDVMVAWEALCMPPAAPMARGS